MTTAPTLGNTTPTCDDNMALGDCNDAKASVPSPNAYLIAQPTYTLSYYSITTRIANS